MVLIARVVVVPARVGLAAELAPCHAGHGGFGDPPPAPGPHVVAALVVVALQRAD